MMVCAACVLFNPGMAQAQEHGRSKHNEKAAAVVAYQVQWACVAADDAFFSPALSLWATQLHMLLWGCAAP